MSDSRITGLALMSISVAAFVGSTSNTLPPVTFFPALALFVGGAIMFMKSNHVALEKAETRAHRAINPRLSENKHAGAHAQRMANRQGAALTHAGHSDTGNENANTVASPNSTQSTRGEEVAVSANDEVFLVNTDVSFPVEVQTGDALADQLLKLKQLLEQGVLTEEEYAVAKSKVLS